MGYLGNEIAPGPAAIEIRLPWGPVIRGQRWGAAPDRVVFVHEPGSDLDSWGSLPAQLAQTLSTGVTAFDLPGHGLSDDPWEPSRLADLWRSLAASANPDFRQVIVSAGLTARAALDCASERPHTALVSLSVQSPDAVLPPRSP